MMTNNDRIIGTCSICGGPVTVPHIFFSVAPPIPQCQRCGAYAQENYGKVIPMRPRRQRGFGPRDSGYNDNVFDDGHWIDVKWG